MLAAVAAACAVQVYAPAGRAKDAPVHGPGLVLSGAGLSAQYPQFLHWIDARIAHPGGTRAGNLVIITASGDRYYSDTFYRYSRLASVREVKIPGCAARADVERVTRYVEHAQAVLFAGGDQANYVPLKGGKLVASIEDVYRRGGIVGGGSAGLAIQGAVIFDSVAADKVFGDDRDVATPDAVRNPYEPAISFTRNLFDWPALRDAITDTHFARRDRFGRLGAFMAREHCAYGVGVDEGAMLLVDARGIATLALRPKKKGEYTPRGAYILSAGVARRLVPGQPLLYSVRVLHLTQEGATYDFRTHTGSGVSYRVTIDGARSPPYTRGPYQ
ncbi:MAG TPA: hypothetical protein VGZ02_07205 [Candidatus Baltobacteraceae bacterium]|jgi:cyanophycinase-like exopeptidase|nr:hypothetical protein [Candidatus Baltobacteraceae bacterium]